MREIIIHPAAEVSPEADLGPGTEVGHGAQIHAGATVGADCRIGANVTIDADARIGDRAEIQHGTAIDRRVTLEEDVLLGPHVVFAATRRPRAFATARPAPILVRRGATVGAHATVLGGITIGAHAVIGAGAVVTRDVPDHALVVGCPGRVAGFACYCGASLEDERPRGQQVHYTCGACRALVRIPLAAHLGLPARLLEIA